ncbi:hypothetical protein [Streptomyces sp. NPDC002215]|uniref:hypothetical protein n=1 Tax=Streptomyces sp. NPDC002215 TaxID=3154412 RepID=UPI00331B823E
MSRHRVFATARVALPLLAPSSDTAQLSLLALLGVEVVTSSGFRRRLNHGRRRVIAMRRLRRMRRSEY